MQKNSPVIAVRQMRRVFKSTKKGAGLKEAVKLILNPEVQEHVALKNVSFEIEQGSFNGLIGANGAGKTTLLKILSGLIAPTHGEARVLGIDPFTRPIEFRKQIALVMGQKAQLWWDLPAVDAFDLLRAIYEIPATAYNDRLKNLTELLDVGKLLNTQIRRLSLGERMKMELIGAILHWPKVIFLDEPTIGLDVLAASRLREFLRVFNQKEKATIILTSHNMDDIERLCSRVLIMKEGSLIYDGKPDGLTGKDECQLKVRLRETPEIAALATMTGVDEKNVQILKDEQDTEAQWIHFTVNQKQAIAVLQTLMLKSHVLSMGIEEPSLESVIERLYRGESIQDLSQSLGVPQ